MEITFNQTKQLKNLLKVNQQIEATTVLHKNDSYLWHINGGEKEKNSNYEGCIVRVVNKNNEVGTGYVVGKYNSLDQAYHLANLCTQKLRLRNFSLTKEKLSIHNTNIQKPNLKYLITEIVDKIRLLNPISAELSWINERRIYSNSFDVEGLTEIGYYTCVINTKDNQIKTYIGTELDNFIRELEDSNTHSIKKIIQKPCSFNKSAFSGSVIFEPLPFSIILSYLGLWFCIQEDSEGKLEDKINKKLAPDFFTLEDNPHYNHPYPIPSFDIEGIKSKKVTLIKEGIIKSCLLDKIAADERGFKETGNKQQMFIKSPSKVSPNILVLNPGNSSKATLIKQIKRGLLIKEIQQLSNGFDFHTGNFNLLVAGNPIESGEIVGEKVKTIIRGNILSLLNQICYIGNDIKEVTFFGRVVCPSVAVDSIHVGGYQL